MPEPVSLVEKILESRYWRKTPFREGLYRAVVVNNQDPSKKGRLQVRIPHLHPAPGTTQLVNIKPNRPFDPFGDLIDLSEANLLPQGLSNSIPAKLPSQEGVPDGLCPWAEPAFPFGGSPNEGFFMVPPVGATVWVGFEMGFTAKPVWLGAWYGKNEVPPEVTDPDKVRLIKTPGGHLLIFDDTEGAEKISLITQDGNRYMIMDDQPGTVTLQTDPNCKIVMTPTELLIQGDTGKYIKITRLTGLIDIITPGNVNVQCGGTAVVNATGQITITSAVNVVINCVNATINASAAIALNAATTLTLGVSATFSILIDTFLTLFNAHVHTDPQGGNTGVPTVPAVPGVHSTTNVTTKI